MDPSPALAGPHVQVLGLAGSCTPLRTAGGQGDASRWTPSACVNVAPRGTPLRVVTQDKRLLIELFKRQAVAPGQRSLQSLAFN